MAILLESYLTGVFSQRAISSGFNLQFCNAASSTFGSLPNPKSQITHHLCLIVIKYSFLSQFLIYNMLALWDDALSISSGSFCFLLFDFVSLTTFA
jgi:hypothetical protein